MNDRYSIYLDTNDSPIVVLDDNQEGTAIEIPVTDLQYVVEELSSKLDEGFAAIAEQFGYEVVE